MSTLREYLGQKREALLARRARQSDTPGLVTIGATTTAEGRSGVRRIRIGEFQIISDSPPDFAGYSLGPSSPEIALGALSSCLTHTFLIHAADRQIPLDSLSVEVQGNLDPRAGQKGADAIPIGPFNITYTVNIESPATAAEIAALQEEVERVCPILNLYRDARPPRGSINLNRGAATPAVAAAD